MVKTTSKAPAVHYGGKETKMAKDGTNRGGRRAGAGRRKKPLADKLQEGRTASVLTMPDLPDEIPMPPVRAFMTEEQRMGELHADEIYTETWDWLKARNCAHLINPILLQEYAMATARWIQIEGVTSQYGFISKHPTTGMPSQSPFVAEAQSYLKLSNTLWLQIDQIVKENCAESYRESPHEDLLESLLDG